MAMARVFMRLQLVSMARAIPGWSTQVSTPDSAGAIMLNFAVLTRPQTCAASTGTTQLQIAATNDDVRPGVDGAHRHVGRHHLLAGQLSAVAGATIKVLALLARASTRRLRRPAGLPSIDDVVRTCCVPLPQSSSIRLYHHVDERHQPNSDGRSARPRLHPHRPARC